MGRSEKAGQEGKMEERDGFFELHGISPEEEEFFKVIYRRRQMYRRIIYVQMLIILMLIAMLCLK